MVDSREGALQTAGSWSREDTIWTDGSRLGNGKVGAVCVWKTPGVWAGRRFHLGTNKEVFDAEVFAIYQALIAIVGRKEGGQQHTIFVDSTAAIEGVRTDSIGPGQRFAIADIETSTRLRARGNEITIRWVPTHQGAPGNKKADKYVKIAADGERPDDAVSDDYR